MTRLGRGGACVRRVDTLIVSAYIHHVVTFVVTTGTLEGLVISVNQHMSAKVTLDVGGIGTVRTLHMISISPCHV